MIKRRVKKNINPSFLFLRLQLIFFLPYIMIKKKTDHTKGNYDIKRIHNIGRKNKKKKNK